MSAGRRVPDLGHRLIAAVTERLPYKGAALFFAIVLWVVASDEEQVERTIPVRLEVSSDGARSLLGVPSEARAVVAGSRRDVSSLLASPPVFRRRMAADGADTLTLELRPEDVQLPPDVHVTVRALLPPSLALRFAPKAVALPKVVR